MSIAESNTSEQKAETPDVEIEANARLIAAAPDLLAALKRIRDARDRYAEHGKYPEELGGRCFDDWAADVADSAISKAEARS